MPTCSKCHSPNLETARVCLICGNPLAEMPPSQALLQARYRLVRVLGQVAAAPQASSMQTCSNCGSPNSGAAIFCRVCAAPLREALPAGTLLQHRYQIVRLLDRGLAGAIYQARDTRQDGCLVAIRENLDVSPEGQARFASRAAALGSLSHPGLARVVGHFVEPSGKGYLVMDLPEGHDLDDMLQEGRLPPPQILTWLNQVCQALGYMHGQSPPVIHGDIRPASIRITSSGQAVLGNFSLMDVPAGGVETRSMARPIVPGFSPLEQYGGEADLDARSDVYALGATAYCLLTVHRPPGAVERIAGKPLIPLSRANPAISPDLEAAIVRSLALDPAGRTQTVGELAAGLAPDTALADTSPAMPLPIAVRPSPADWPPLPPALALPPNYPTRPNIAGIGVRFLAYLVDGLIVGAMQFGVSILIAAPLFIRRNPVRPLGGLWPLYLLSFGIWLAYYTYFHGSSGRTPGKMLFGLRVVCTDGSKLSYGRSLGRTLGYIVSGMIFDLGYLWAIWDVDRQAWHDKLADTYVIEG